MKTLIAILAIVSLSIVSCKKDNMVKPITQPIADSVKLTLNISINLDTSCMLQGSNYLINKNYSKEKVFPYNIGSSYTLTGMFKIGDTLSLNINPSVNYNVLTQTKLNVSVIKTLTNVPLNVWNFPGFEGMNVYMTYIYIVKN